MNQLFLAIFGITAVWLSQDNRDHVRRWACIFGLCSQPFWFYATWTAGQYGIFFLCFFYLGAWLRGFNNNWLKSKLA